MNHPKPRKFDSHKILIGDVIERLRELPADSVHCVVTSPHQRPLSDFPFIQIFSHQPTYSSENVVIAMDRGVPYLFGKLRAPVTFVLCRCRLACNLLSTSALRACRLLTRKYGSSFASAAAACLSLVDQHHIPVRPMFSRSRWKLPPNVSLSNPTAARTFILTCIRAWYPGVLRSWQRYALDFLIPMYPSPSTIPARYAKVVST